jgi:hypothetical protein
MTHSDADLHGPTEGASSPLPLDPPYDVLDDEEPPPPVRLRRRKLPAITLALGLAATLGAGFYGGVRVEKAQLTSGSASSSSSDTAAARFAALAAANGSAGAGRGAATGTPTPTPGAGGQTGGQTGGAANIVGTVAVVDGTTLYVTDANGDTVKVTTSSGTTVTKTTTGTVKDIAPGQTVVVRGVQSSDGVYAAQSVTQGGAGGFGGGGFGGFGGRGGRTGTSGANATQAPTTGG